MSDPYRRRPHLRIIKSDYVSDSIAMLRGLPLESVLTYLVVVASEAQAVGQLDDVLRARLSRLAARMMKEMDKAA